MPPLQAKTNPIPVNSSNALHSLVANQLKSESLVECRFQCSTNFPSFLFVLTHSRPRASAGQAARQGDWQQY